MAGWSPWARNVPLYTWPSDAAATGSAESRSKSASTWLASRSPHSVAMVARAWADGKAGTRSCSPVRAVMYAGGSRSARIESAWPTLMNVGPIAVSAVTSCSARTRALSLSVSGPRSQSISSDSPQPDAGTRLLSSVSTTSSGRAAAYAAPVAGS